MIKNLARLETVWLTLLFLPLVGGCLGGGLQPAPDHSSQSRSSDSDSNSGLAVTSSGDGNETISPSSEKVSSGATQTFTVTAHSGYFLSSTVGGTCPAGSWSGSTYTTGAITTSCSVTFSGVVIITMTSNQTAAFVVGEPDFTSVNTSTISSSLVLGGSGGPAGSPALYGGNLYLSDYTNNRILGFVPFPIIDGASANLLLGPTTFTSNTDGTSSTLFHTPESVSIAETGQMAVADTLNSRILLFNSVPTSNNTPASFVVGQADFTSTAHICTQSSVYGPEGVFIGHGKLIIPDESNARVMIWNTIPTSNNANADLVLGQPNFTTCTVPTNGQASSSTMQAPTDVWTDGTKLIVTDQNWSRILIWNTFPTTNNQPADVVLGQTSFTGIAANRGGSTDSIGFSAPSFVASNGRQLFLTDTMNNRVLMWNEIPTVSGTPADVVLGQTSFSGSSSGTTSTTLNSPYGIGLLGSNVVVNDSQNARYLVFQGQ